jgi:hypothetical protein
MEATADRFDEIVSGSKPLAKPGKNNRLFWQINLETDGT